MHLSINGTASYVFTLYSFTPLRTYPAPHRPPADRRPGSVPPHAGVGRHTCRITVSWEGPGPPAPESRSSTSLNLVQSNLLAVLFALASALTIAWGTVIRHRIAIRTPTDGSLRSSPLLNALMTPMWWAGLSTALLAYGLQTIALGFGTLLVVQPVLVLSLMFTLPLSARFNGYRLKKSEISWASVLTVAVAVLVLLGRPLPGDPHPPLERWTPALLIGVLGMGAMWVLAQYVLTSEKALILGLLTGALFGYVAVFSKAAVDIFIHQGISGLILNWEVYALILTATLGTIVQQYSFNAGELKTSLPAMTIGEPIVAFTLGYAVLGERFQVDSWEWIFMIAALLAMLISTVMLSRKGVS